MLRVPDSKQTEMELVVLENLVPEIKNSLFQESLRGGGVMNVLLIIFTFLIPLPK